MKKYIAIILAFITVLSFASCGSKNGGSAGEESTSKAEEINVDKKILDVTVNLPASLFNDKSEEDIKKEAEENGYKSCTIHEDGSVTYVMSKAVYKKTLEDFYSTFEEGCQEMVDDTDDYKNITNIEYNKDFSKINVYLDTSISRDPPMFTSLTLLLSGAYYQAFLGVKEEDYDVVIGYYDETGDELIDTVSLKEIKASSGETEES